MPGFGGLFSMSSWPDDEDDDLEFDWPTDNSWQRTLDYIRSRPVTYDCPELER